MKTQRGYSFFNFGARWSGWSTPLPSRFTPWEKDMTPFLIFERASLVSMLKKKAN
jgi:hypothetical protein